MSARQTVVGKSPRNGLPIAVDIEDGYVIALRETSSDTTEWIAPGLVDLQVNGFAGYDFNGTEPDPELIVLAARRLLGEGVTTFVPTLITASHGEICSRLQAIAKARREDALTAHMVPYVHLEGPHLSPQDGPRGIHDRAFIRPPSFDEFEIWQAASEGLIGMVTLSPHWEGSAEYIAALAARSILVAIGHTHANDEQIRRAVEAGARLSTHLGNGAHAMLPRHPNYLWSQLAEDALTAGFIADGHHLPRATLRSMLRAKGLERCVLVSDVTALAGCAPGRYRTPVGGDVELSESGRLSLVGSPLLAGAARSLGYGVAFVADDRAFGLGVALQLATVNPGRFAGDRGILAPGRPADLIVFNWRPGDSRLLVGTSLAEGRAHL